MAELTVSICIATHNRRDDLARTLGELARLAPAPQVVLVAADGCTDGTLELLRTEYPQARLIEHAQARGSIPSRNELARACNSDLFVSLDDDSYPLEPDFLARVAACFAREPRLAVLSFAQRSDEDPDSLTAKDFGAARYEASYANSGAAIRRSVFLELGGYPDVFFHAYEEPDFALRCAAAGWQVRFEPSLVVRHHFTGVGRDERRTHQRHARNELWSVLLRCPWPLLVPVALWRVARQFGYACKRGWALAEPQWWLAAWRGFGACWRARRPLPVAAYLGWMKLLRRPVSSETEWNKIFARGSQASPPDS
jgi:GT2 family glycosyltransferase